MTNRQHPPEAWIEKENGPNSDIAQLKAYIKQIEWIVNQHQQGRRCPRIIRVAPQVEQIIDNIKRNHQRRPHRGRVPPTDNRKPPNQPQRRPGIEAAHCQPCPHPRKQVREQGIEHGHVEPADRKDMHHPGGGKTLGQRALHRFTIAQNQRGQDGLLFFRQSEVGVSIDQLGLPLRRAFLPRGEGTRREREPEIGVKQSKRKTGGEKNRAPKSPPCVVHPPFSACGRADDEQKTSAREEGGQLADVGTINGGDNARYPGKERTEEGT